VRNISFSMTTEAVRRREKTVTRRLAWWNLKPGDLLQAVEKAQGLKKGEHVKPICAIRVVSVRREPLNHFVTFKWAMELAREGFPELIPAEFLDVFCRANRCNVDTLVNRIEFAYVLTHACPPDGSGIMPCCGRTPFEVPRTDRMTLDPSLVTCSPAWPPLP
jgi:hypothetical protein